MTRALQALSDPDRLFDDLGSDPGVLWPVVFVVCAGLLDVVDQVLLQQKLQAAMPGGGGTGQALGLLTSVAGSVVRPVVAWIAVAVALYAISTRLGGDGDLGTTVKFVGWGFLPALLLSVLTTAVAAVVIGGMPSPSGPEELGTFLRAVNENGYVTVAGYLPVAFTVWQGFIWTFAVRHARDLPVADAAKTVAGPVAAIVAWTLYVQMSGVPRAVFELPFAGILLGGGGPV